MLQKNEGDVTVIDVRRVAADFHSRYKAQERTYVSINFNLLISSCVVHSACLHFMSETSVICTAAPTY